MKMKINWKKILLWLLSVAIIWIWWYWLVNATWMNDYTANMYTEPSHANSSTIWISTIGTNADRWGWLIQVIKNAINRVLGMLSLIALVLCLWWWFQIVTAAWDEWKQKKWISVLKHAAIWLVVIWLSWFIVTIIFWLLRGVTWAEPTTTP
jgi:hypothetical protein